MKKEEIKQKIKELKEEIQDIDINEKYITDNDDIYEELQIEKMREISFICNEIEELEKELEKELENE